MGGGTYPSRMNVEGDDVWVFKVDFPADPAHCRLAGAVGGIGDGDPVHSSNGACSGADGDEFRIAT